MIKIVIETENQAFKENPDELSRILRIVASHLEISSMPLKIYDINGNTVGKCFETGKLNFDRREINTIITALRRFQDIPEPQRKRMSHFHGVESLDNKEIGLLCEKIICEGGI